MPKSSVPFVLILLIFYKWQIARYSLALCINLLVMRSVFFLIAFLFFGLFVQAQHNHFIYLQSDNKQPFYVKVKEMIYSSSASGYVIIPRMQAGTYNLAVGFPKNEFAAQTIPVTIAGKDLGYLLKNFEGKGWGLFNIQTMDVIMSNAATNSQSKAATETRSDDFSNTLADVVNTPSIKEIKKEQPKEEKKSAIVKKEDAVAVIPSSGVQEPVKTEENRTVPEQEKAPGSFTGIKRIGYSQTSDGASITYLLSNGAGTDTVDVFMPIEEIPVPVSKPAEKAEVSKVTKPGDNKAEKKEAGEPRFIEIDLPETDKTNNPAGNSGEVKKGNTPKPIGTDTGKPETAGSSLKMINSDCKSIATEDDFMKARKKMTAQKSDEDMVSAAKKLFKQKCYSTEQVKNLSVLFLKDEGKYKFFDAVYPFVYDSPEFRQLESQLSDEYYISRFRSMLRN